jgi:hypothetical protein
MVCAGGARGSSKYPRRNVTSPWVVLVIASLLALLPALADARPDDPTLPAHQRRRIML